MFRFLVFLLLVLGLGLLFAWVADNPGTIFLKWEWLATQMGRPGDEVGIPLTLAVVLLVGLIFFIMLGWGVLRSIIGAPTLLSKYFDNHKREKGYKALSQGLIAASSGDASTARKLTKESKKLLGNDPLVALLGTQTAILEGKRDEARENFKIMLSDDSTKMVALRGLFLEAERQGEAEAASYYADEAARIDSSLPWAGNAKLRYSASNGDWDTAIRTLDSNRAAGLIEKQAAKRQRAVLLTGKALSKEAEDPQYAAQLAKEAHKLVKDFVPAATTYARVATRNGDVRAASKVIETTWKLSPHPELSDAYSAVRSGDSAKDRLKRALKLSNLAPNNLESGLAVATAAITAGEWDLARTSLEPILTSKPTERACLLMADIEEGEHGDKGRMRDWLSRAVRAEPNQAWVAGTHVSDEWLPVSPISGEIDAFEWKTPVQQLGNNEAPVMTLEELQAEAIPLETETTSHEDEQSEIEDAIVVESDEITQSEPIPESVVITASAAAGAVVSDDDIVAHVSDTKEDGTRSDSKANESDIPSSQNYNQPEKIDELPNKLAANVKDEANEIINENDNTVEFPLKRRPDDPGPHPDKEPPKKGFKLF